MSELADKSQGEVMATVYASIRAVMQRVGTYRHLSEKEFVDEVLWFTRQVRVNSDGTIAWRSFELGRRLLESLGEAQIWRCCYCGSHTSTAFHMALKDEHKPTIEHVIPVSNGGSDHPDNLVMACYRCNQLRGNMELQAFLKLLQYYLWAWDQPSAVSVHGTRERR